MSFFQLSILNKYLKAQNREQINSAYDKYVHYFHNPQIQRNIREVNEEQFQQKFLIELYVKVLGYTINPDPDYNLTTEFKNEKGQKKADGAILKNGKAIAVIELKGTDTKNLDKITTQAFNYKNNQTGCIYVITSNFEKLRFFIHHSVEHIEFNLFTLTEREFESLWLCLSAEYLLGGVPLKVKEESLSVEENVTKQLYKDYAGFRADIWQNMVKNSPHSDRLLLFKKTQKLLDRFLFIFFAEDSGLLPPNSIFRIVRRWNLLQEEDAYKTLYDIFKQYFGYINAGRKGKTAQDDIFAYNGGLFLPDNVLDNIVIDDDVLHFHVMKLTGYDFQSEVDVNILGHIFENSLNEIENVIARLEGKEVEKNKSKRKKDGVYYTPKYITKYIVDNTIGKLCEEKKAELGIIEKDYAKGRRNRKKETIKKLDARLQTYREWLRNITICDPACGSGAFLNQAIEFLIAEHAYIDELHAQLFGISIVFQDVSNHILEKNIYGVDINEESVEIAKLSLWLRTAQRGRKLTSLSNNIKCGNSLIDDPGIAGDKAFNWQKEFPEVFTEKIKTVHHITWVTHNSRVSQRMIEYKVKKGEAFWLTEELENKVTEIIADIVQKDDLNVLAYNICGDHVHIILVCEETEVPTIVGKLKGKSSQRLKEYLQIPKEEQFTLWAQKYSNTTIDDDEQLWNAVGYIKANREKHKLPGNKGLQPLVDRMCCDYEYTYRTEYKGGFDVVIGNPPYGAELSVEHKKYLEINYMTFEYQVNTYALFYEKGVEILQKGGMLGYITPATFTYQHYFKKLRDFLQKYKHIGISKYFYEVFDDADIGDSVSWLLMKINNDKSSMLIQICKTREDAMKPPVLKKYSSIIKDDSIYVLSETEINISNFYINSKRLGDIVNIIVGVKAYQNGKGNPKQTSEIVKNKVFSADSKVDETYIKCIIGKDFHRYRYVREPSMYLSYGKWLAEPRESAPFFDSGKIILRQTADSIIGHIDNLKRINLNNVYNIGKRDPGYGLKYLLALLNSKLVNFIYQDIAQERGRVFAEVKKVNLVKLPMKITGKDKQNDFIKKVDYIINQNLLLQNLQSDFTNLLQNKYKIKKLSKKLQNWYELDFADFLKELEKARKQAAKAATRDCSPLSLADQAKWMQYFNEQRQKALELKCEIDKIDKEIDQMVYELYGLTEEEIQIIENA